MADNVPFTPGSGSTFATDEIGGVHYQRVKVSWGVDGVAVDASASNPLPVTGTLAVTGTFFQATQPVSGTVTINAIPAGTNNIGDVDVLTLPALVAGTALIGKVGIDQTTPGTTNKVNIGTDGTVAINAALPTGANVIGALTANQSVNVAQMNGVAVTMGSGVTGTGVQRVVLATDVALPTGSNVIGALTANQSINNAQVSGTAIDVNSGNKSAGTMRVVLATDQPALTNKLLVTPDSVALPANQSVNVSQMNGVAVTMGSGITGTGVQRVVLATDVALPAGTNVIGALSANQAVNNAQFNGVTPLMGNGATGTGSLRVTIASDNTAFSVNAIQATLTKGTQGATGVSTQDLKDAGRVSFGLATVIGGVTAVTTEALLTMVAVRAGTAAGTATTNAVTSGKRLRITAIVASVRSSAATVISARVALRMNPSGAVTASSPIIAILSMTQQAAALAEAGDTCVLAIPDGIEFSGTEQFGLSQVASGTGGVVYASIIGFEY